MVAVSPLIDHNRAKLAFCPKKMYSGKNLKGTAVVKKLWDSICREIKIPQIIINLV